MKENYILHLAISHRFIELVEPYGHIVTESNRTVDFVGNSFSYSG